MESSRLFRLALRQGGDESLRAPETYSMGRDRLRTETCDRAISITVVETIEDLEKVFALRTAVSLSGAAGESRETDIDESDFGSVHLLAWIGQEVWGSLRIRIVEGAGFLDRIVIKHHRYRLSIESQMIETAMALCRAKGVAMVTRCSTHDAGVLMRNGVDIDMEEAETTEAWDGAAKTNSHSMGTSGSRLTGS